MASPLLRKAPRAAFERAFVNNLRFELGLHPRKSFTAPQLMALGASLMTLGASLMTLACSPGAEAPEPSTIASTTATSLPSTMPSSATASPSANTTSTTTADTRTSTPPTASSGSGPNTSSGPNTTSTSATSNATPATTSSEVVESFTTTGESNTAAETNTTDISTAGNSDSSSAGPVSTVYEYAASVENTSQDCEVPTLAEPNTLAAFEKLPDPFKKLDGSVVTTKAEWHCRRQEIRKQAEKYIYGEKPMPDMVSGSVTNTKVDVHVEAMGTSIDFSAKVVLPQGDGPFPALINVGSSGLTLGEDRVLSQGVAVIYYNHYDLGKEGTPEQSRGKPNPGKFYDIYGGTHSAGLLMAWAWGASRLIDVIQQSDGSIIDVGKLGVTGCSRNGKGAFAIGVFDERIALTIPHETSTAGVPVYRMVDILNTERTDHNYFGLNWFSNNFEPFVYANNTSNVVKLPIDTHELVALVAPRGLLVLENPHETQMSAPAGHLATAAGAEVYEALGVGDHVSYHSDVPDTGHCAYKDAYTDLIARNISRFLKREDAKTGDFVVGPNGDGNVSEWKQWTTPTLAD